jgi:hypothetical protein
MVQLRLTTTEPRSMFESRSEALINPDNKGKLIFGELRGSTAYLHGKAEAIAGFDIPLFIDGNLTQLDMPIQDQDILLLLPKGEYKCKANYIKDGLESKYYITLKEDPLDLDNLEL